MNKIVSNYYKKAEAYSTKRFIFEMYVITLISKILLSVTFFLLIELFALTENILLNDFESSATSFLNNFHWIIGFLLLCLIAPFFETVMGQMIPIYFGSIFFNNKTILILLSVICNTAYHYPYDLFDFSLVLILSFVLAFSFIINRNESYWKAIYVTTVIHALYNFIPFLMVYLF